MQKTPLYDEHLRIGGKIVDFNGWALPVQFAGIVKEHVHTRTQVSLFDCSHMGEYIVKGQDAIAKYDREIISDTSKIPLGRCRYGAILNEQGGILDDLITFRMAADELYVVTNAGPLEAVTNRFCAKNPGMKHISYETAKIDVQGPRAQEIVLKAGFAPAKTLPYFNATWTTWDGHKVLLSRTGYTGELGYELFMDNDLSVKMWQRFLELGVEPAGLGARDTLRTEVGYNLSGQDFDSTITPLEANMESYIAWDTEFVGKAALKKKLDAGHWQRLVGIVTRSKQKPQHGFAVMHGEKMHEALGRLGYVTTHHVSEGLANQLGIATVKLSDREIPERVRNLVNGNIVQVYKIIPIEEDGKVLKVATSDPTNVNALENLTRLLNRPIEPLLATKEEIQAAVDKYYGSSTTARPAITESATGIVDKSTASVNQTVGEVTSGTFGPSLGYGVGLARVPEALSQPGTKLTCGPRGLEIEVAKTPFYTKGTCRAKVT